MKTRIKLQETINSVMKKEIRTIDEKNRVLQITCTDERWYSFESKNKVTNLPEFHFVPSVTWICEYYPKGIAFFKWLASKGWDEAESIKVAAGDKGSKVHHAIGELLEGKTIEMMAPYLNPTTEQLEPLTVEEYNCIMSFVRWYEAVKPEILAREFVVVNKQENYAGMVDLACKIDGQYYIVDFKTSQYIWPSHELQVSAYKHAKTPLLLPGPLSNCKLAILQIGYKRNKNQYKFTEIKDKYVQFLAAKTIWANETKGIFPKQKDYPLSVSLNIQKKL